MDEFDVLSIVGEGWFGKILLVEHKATDTEMVLKGKKKVDLYANTWWSEQALCKLCASCWGKCQVNNLVIVPLE